MLIRQPIIRAPDGADGPAGGAPGAAEHIAKPGYLDPIALQRLHELDPLGKGKLFERVVEAFNTSTNRLLPQMRLAGQAGDLNGVRHVAHTLKSSSASLGATRLSSLCADLEQQMRGGIAFDVDGQIERIAAEITVVLQALKVMTEPAE